MLSYVPAECVVKQTDFYTALALKTIGPMVVIALLWTKPLLYFVAGRKDAVQAASQDATAWSMLLLELCLPSVSTQISETFVCEHFQGEGAPESREMRAC